MLSYDNEHIHPKGQVGNNRVGNSVPSKLRGMHGHLCCAARRTCADVHTEHLRGGMLVGNVYLLIFDTKAAERGGRGKKPNKRHFT